MRARHAGPEKELWIGLVEVRPRNGGSEFLGDAKGAFVNIVTWASDAEEYGRNVDKLVESLGGLCIAEIATPEPVEERRQSTGGFRDEVEELISRAEDHPDAIVYGTFHCFENEDA